MSSVLTDAIRDDVQRYRVPPEVRRHLEDSMTDNEGLGKLLANGGLSRAESE